MTTETDLREAYSHLSRTAPSRTALDLPRRAGVRRGRLRLVLVAATVLLLALASPVLVHRLRQDGQSTPQAPTRATFPTAYFFGPSSLPGYNLDIEGLGADGQTFEFMASEVSSEKPQALLVQQVAQQMRDVRAGGQKILWVCGPGVVHTGAAPAMVALVEAGFVDVLFAGNALATHDIESSLFGTSLGIDLARGLGVEHGHEHHIRAINTIRRSGSIAAAVESGVLTGGIMHAMVRGGHPFVLVGSVRDDGPLPDVWTDVIDGQRAMRSHVPGVGFAIMVATMLHSIATGNLLPASIPLVCVDINPATVTKLADRGSAQAVGIVTDVGLFLEQLALQLVPAYHRT